MSVGAELPETLDAAKRLQADIDSKKLNADQMKYGLTSLMGLLESESKKQVTCLR